MKPYCSNVLSGVICGWVGVWVEWVPPKAHTGEYAQEREREAGRQGEVHTTSSLPRPLPDKEQPMRTQALGTFAGRGTLPSRTWASSPTQQTRNEKTRKIGATRKTRKRGWLYCAFL